MGWRNDPKRTRDSWGIGNGGKTHQLLETRRPLQPHPAKGRRKSTGPESRRLQPAAVTHPWVQIADALGSGPVATRLRGRASGVIPKPRPTPPPLPGEEQRLAIDSGFDTDQAQIESLVKHRIFT